MAPVDEWLIPTDPEAVIAQATDAIGVHGLHALKIIPTYAYRMAGSQSFDEPSWRPFWDAVDASSTCRSSSPSDPSPGSTDPVQGFIDELWTLAAGWIATPTSRRASPTASPGAT